MNAVGYWMLGLSTSVVGGALVTRVFLDGLRKFMRLEKEEPADETTRPAPPWLTGALERLFFTLVVAFGIPGAPAAMLIWLTLKTATNWNSPFRGGEPNLKRVRFAFSSLLAGLVSMTFALMGGVICQRAGS
jgi:hypothetical protein